MSEYQYYEFLAIDRLLSRDEMAELRALSTRAHITPVSFTNVYNWGDFKGDPKKLMQRYFDAHVYVANWMTAIFMIRLPIGALAKETAEAMAVDDILDFNPTKTHWIITWSLEDSEDYDRFGMEDGSGWMARLSPVRDELLRGDLRSLYIGWLAAVTGGMMDDDEMEPLSMSGLGNLTAAQHALAEFLEVDPDLLAGVGLDSPVDQSRDTSDKDLDLWIDTLPRVDIKAVMKQLVEGKGQQAERSMKNRFEAWQRGLQTDKTDAPRRTVGELRKHAEAAEKTRLEKQKRERQKSEIEHRKKHESYLQKLSKDFPKAWKRVQQTVERGSGVAYDDACRSLVDLSEAYMLHASKERFQIELKKFMACNIRRKTLLQRLVTAGIWEDT